MIGLVITGHGQFASGVQSAVHMVTGEKRQLAYVDFTQSMSTDDLHSALRKAADLVDSGEGVLFLSDIPGGSPFQQSTAVAANLRLADVVSGTNLVMAAEACLEREFSDFRALVSEAISKGQGDIKSFYAESLSQRAARYTNGGI